jgi:demethylmenaquinone methyltransferase/2-methoxy-6-polyprenyl-1,4-benzoquinol methylase
VSDAVRSMFSAIAWRYDLANRLISLGQDQSWRSALAAAALSAKPSRLLDCACGSGDVSLKLLLHPRAGPGSRVLGVDFSLEMLALARAKARRAGYHEDRLRFEHADILALPFPDASFDACTIAFGVRNLDDPRAGIIQMARVLRPGAPLCILETGHAASPLLAMLQRGWSRFALPLIGGITSGNPAAYRYLHTTAEAFPSGAAFVELLESCGVFSDILSRPLSGGLVWLYTARVSGKSGSVKMD